MVFMGSSLIFAGILIFGLCFLLILDLIFPGNIFGTVGPVDIKSTVLSIVISVCGGAIAFGLGLAAVFKSDKYR